MDLEISAYELTGGVLAVVRGERDIAASPG
jgi:hypothetical protein